MNMELVNLISKPLRETMKEKEKARQEAYRAYEVLNNMDLSEISAEKYLSAKWIWEESDTKMRELNIRIEALSEAREIIMDWSLNEY